MTDSGWIKLQRSKAVWELLTRDPKAFHLLTVIAWRAKRTDDFSIHELKPGQALIGDYKNYAMTEKEYRGAKKRIQKYGFAAFHGTNKGTIATLSNTMVYDINILAKGEQNGRQRAGEGRTEGGQRATNKNERNKEDKNERSNTALPEPDGGVDVETLYSIGDTGRWDGQQPVDYAAFVDAFNGLYGKRLQITDEKRKQIRARLRTYTAAQILQAWESRLRNDWLRTEGKKFMGDWKAAMRNDERIDKYLNTGSDGPMPEQARPKDPQELISMGYLTVEQAKRHARETYGWPLKKCLASYDIVRVSEQETYLKPI